jgi:hypothetical protein
MRLEVFTWGARSNRRKPAIHAASNGLRSGAKAQGGGIGDVGDGGARGLAGRWGDGRSSGARRWVARVARGVARAHSFSKLGATLLFIKINKYAAWKPAVQLQKKSKYVVQLSLQIGAVSPEAIEQEAIILLNLEQCLTTLSTKKSRRNWWLVEYNFCNYSKLYGPMGYSPS